jgi:phosphoglucomutase
MGLGKTAPEDEPPLFGAAADGDADRNMILGRRQALCFSFSWKIIHKILCMHQVVMQFICKSDVH